MLTNQSCLQETQTDVKGFQLQEARLEANVSRTLKNCIVHAHNICGCVVARSMCGDFATVVCGDFLRQVHRRCDLLDYRGKQGGFSKYPLRDLV